MLSDVSYMKSFLVFFSKPRGNLRIVYFDNLKK